MNNYIEFSFHLPFYDLIYDSWSDLNVLDNHEIIAIAEWMDVAFDIEILTKEYEKTVPNHGDIFIFYNTIDKEKFLYFDLFNEKTDQCGMIQFGLRCLHSERETALQLLDPLFYKNSPRSALSMDWSNQMMFRSIENSDFYLKKRRLFFFSDAN
jgi:hypothetical protein